MGTGGAACVPELYLGGVFLLSSMWKIVDLVQFTNTVRMYMLVPDRWAPLIAWSLAYCELALALCLLLGVDVHVGTRVGQALLVVFCIALVVNLVRGRSIPCGCFSPGEAISWRTVWRDLAWLAFLTGLLEGERLVPSRLFAIFPDWPWTLRWTIVALLTISGTWWSGLVVPTSVGAELGAAIERSGPFPGDRLDLAAVEAGATHEYTLVALVGRDMASQLLKAWVDVERPSFVGQALLVDSENPPEQFAGIPVPSVFVVDPEGRVSLRWIGFDLPSWDMMAEAIKETRDHPETSCYGQVALAPGTRMPPLQLVDRTGNPVRLEFREGVSYLLYFYDPRCSVCPAVTRLVTESSGFLPPSYRTVCVVLGACSENARERTAELGQSPSSAAIARRLDEAGASFSDLALYSLSTAVRDTSSDLRAIRLLYDVDGRVQRTLGIWTVPALLVVEDGRLRDEAALFLVHTRNAAPHPLELLGLTHAQPSPEFPASPIPHRREV